VSALYAVDPDIVNWLITIGGKDFIFYQFINLNGNKFVISDMLDLTQTSLTGIILNLSAGNYPFQIQHVKPGSK